MTIRWKWIDIGALLALGLIGGMGARLLGVPLPYMVGSLALSAAYTLGWGRAGRIVRFPQHMRFYGIALIGTMIGTRFSPDLFGMAAQMWPSFLAILGFVLLAHGYSYSVLRGLGGYDEPTATYGGLPGGLVEAVAMGEKAGANVPLMTVHHFARVILVVVSVPFLFQWIGGETVGSSAGQTMENGPSGWLDLGQIVVLSGIGMWLGRTLRLPAGPLMGPLLLCGLGQVTGVLDLHSPGWLLNVAQLVVGASLGSQFAGITRRMLIRTFGLSVIVVAGTLVIGAGIAAALTRYVPVGFEPLFISFAPGGMTEMGLIALSLDASPVIVTAHHLLRIVFAVLFVSIMARRRTGPG